MISVLFGILLPIFLSGLFIGMTIGSRKARKEYEPLIDRYLSNLAALDASAKEGEK